ncbi:MAG TPA: hypothetical protein VMC80_00135 [Patescibacteria group bacterium]|nr:hypothetical protein [Patescibacteria group bacterium]
MSYSKKGIEPVIGIMLLIIIGLALSATIFIFIRNYNLNLQAGFSGQAGCRDYTFSVGDVCYNNVTVNSVNGITLQFNVINYSPSVNLTGFKISVYYSGSIKNAEFDYPIPATKTGRVTSSFITGTSTISRISVFPKIETGNTNVTCGDVEDDVAGSEIKPC